MDDGLIAAESGVMDQGSEDEDFKRRVAAAVAVASGGEVAVDSRQRTAEASTRGS